VVKLSAFYGHFLSTEVTVHFYSYMRHQPLHPERIRRLEGNTLQIESYTPTMNTGSYQPVY